MRFKLISTALVMTTTGLMATGCGTQNSSTSSSPANTSTNTTTSSTAANTTAANTTASQATNSTTGSSGSTTDADKKITLGYINWAEDIAATYLWKNILTNKGYQVTMKSVALGPMFEGLYKDGVNVFFDSWMPQQTNDMKKYGDKLTNLGKWYTGVTKEGFVVPDYMTKVSSIADLKKIKSKLGGKIVGIDPGAVEMQIAQKSLDTYGVHLKLQASSGPAMLSALKRAYDAKKPIAVVLWSPHWAFAKYKLKYLKDPKGTFGKAGYIQGLANKTWATNHPTAVHWLEAFKLTPHQLGILEDDINHAKSPDAGVKKWMAANQSLVNSWTS